MLRIGNRVSQLVAEITEYFIPTAGTEEEDLNTKVEELASSFLEYVGMRVRVFPEQGLFVEVEELIFRYGEPKRAIECALRFLESRGLAPSTKFEGRWRLRVDLQPVSTAV